MKQNDLDDRIHTFIAGRTQKPLSASVAGWFKGKFGDRESAIQVGDAIVGMKYEPASRGKF